MPTHSPKKNALKKGLVGCLTALVIACLGLVVLYYGARWGYYQGRWGKDNPVARYLWLCDAPAGFERTLYPENVEILAPACENFNGLGHHSVQFTSDKQYLYLGNSVDKSGYWLEIATKQVTTTRPTNVRYLADWRREGDERINVWFDLDSHEVITTYPGGVTLMVCGKNYDFEEGLISEDKRRIAKLDGIYDAVSGEKLLGYGIGDYDSISYLPSIHLFYPCAWFPDNQGIILEPGITWGLELLIWERYGDDLPNTNYPVPQPVLKFNVPEAYR